jgi:putative FmdB family regulatory protein
MAHYEYSCKNCKNHIAAIHSMNETYKEKCLRCGKKKWEQHIFPPAIQFKGSGFYQTDYKDKGK